MQIGVDDDDGGDASLTSFRVISNCITLFPNTISSLRTMMKSFCWHKTPTIETCDLLMSFASNDKKGR